MEGVACNIRENVDVFEHDGHAAKRIHLGGGGSRNPVWCRMISNVLGRDVRLLTVRDASVVGAAILAGAGVRFFPSLEEAAGRAVKTGETYACDGEQSAKYNRLYQQYRKVYPCLNAFYRESVDG